MASEPMILCDFWYARELGKNFHLFETQLLKSLGKRLSTLVLQINFLRAITLFVMARSYDYVIPDWNKYGRSYCLLHWFDSTRRIVFLECIDFANLHKSSARTFLLKAFSKFVWGPAMQRSIAKMQVMTSWERLEIARAYGIDIKRIRCIEWPLMYSEATYTGPADPGYVFSSGRACCDWETLFEAARYGSWPLVVVCSPGDLPKIQLLNSSDRAKIYCDISKEEHDQLMRSASVTVISLEERMTSAGQIRLGESIAAGIPVIATRIRGLEGYLIGGTTGISVGVGNAKEMADAIDSLLRDAAGRKRLATEARKHCAHFTRSIYFRKIHQFVSIEQIDYVKLQNQAAETRRRK